jgi:hypothetical protein
MLGALTFPPGSCPNGAPYSLGRGGISTAAHSRFGECFDDSIDHVQPAPVSAAGDKTKIPRCAALHGRNKIGLEEEI